MQIRLEQFEINTDKIGNFRKKKGPLSAVHHPNLNRLAPRRKIFSYYFPCHILYPAGRQIDV